MFLVQLEIRMRHLLEVWQNIFGIVVWCFIEPMLIVHFKASMIDHIVYKLCSTESFARWPIANIIDKCFTRMFLWLGFILPIE